MPSNPADVKVNVTPASPRGFQPGIPVVIGYDSSFATADSPKKYFNARSIETDHGAATKTSTAAKNILKSASSVVIVKPKVTAIAAETFGAVQTGTLAQKPITATTAPVIRVDSTSKTVKFTYASPPTTPAAGEVVVNPNTGEWEAGDTVASSVEFDYSYIDYTTLVDGLNSKRNDLGPYELFVFPALPAKVDNYGDFEGLSVKAEAEDWILFGHLPKSETVANAKDFRTNVNSKQTIVFAHKSDADVAPLVTGVASRLNPWDTLAYRPIPALDMTEFYLPSEIGGVETTDTFEGEGINVIHRYGNRDALSNERTLIAYSDTSGELYLSIPRTRVNLASRLRQALTNLLLVNPKVGFSEKGIGSVTLTINRVMEDLVAEDAIFPAGTTQDDGTEVGYVVKPPILSAITSADKKARKLGPFEVTCTMIEPAHEITVEVSLEVA